MTAVTGEGWPSWSGDSDTGIGYAQNVGALYGRLLSGLVVSLFCLLGQRFSRMPD